MEKDLALLAIRANGEAGWPASMGRREEIRQRHLITTGHFTFYALKKTLLDSFNQVLF